ncbi:YebC/PmpR family DNA-binding regulatory protein [Simiduia aestuariiviva]|uniref:Probable transcriptional regulatory protein FHS30_000968 n=2 Tax=Simiduia aestuariiviva TaxID=1510459 RepID=A0A839UIV4_9GAMM|nr:YebC/PmpR family DNA-binding regulatory protein [Simiduia aestuariiviva]
MAKTADAKSKVYSKYGREIYVCAKSGGVEPDGNLSLRNLIEKAKKDQVPAHVIDKALQKAKGGGGEDFSPARYEGFGPGNCMVIVECLTDNPNRTFGDVRQCFVKTKSKIGTLGSVSHMFDHGALFVFTGDEEAVLEALMEADVDVIDIESEGEKVTVITPHTDYFKAKTTLQEAFEGIDFDIDEIQFLPRDTTPVEGEDREMFDKMMEMLNDVDDVQNVYHSASLSD